MTFPAHQCLMHIPFRVVSIDEENHGKRVRERIRVRIAQKRSFI